VKKKILISIWSDPSNYINLLFLINFLISKKIEIVLICKEIEKKKDFFYFVKKTRLLKIIEIKKNNKIGLVNFFFNILLSYVRFNPVKILAINFIALFFCSLIVKKKVKFIYYNFDFDLSKNLNFNNFLEKFSLNKVDYIFLPSKSRLFLYKKKFKRSNHILSINNCFSKYFKTEKKNLLKKYRFLNQRKYFVRLGSFYKYHYLEELALSTKYWDKNFLLVMAGKSYEGYFKKLKHFVKINNLNRVILYENVSYKQWFNLLDNAYGGFALYEPINVSHRLMGGTSQKLNNYIYSGIPSIISNTKDTLIFNNKFDTSLLVKNSPKGIAQKVNLLINNKSLYKSKVKKNILAFKNEFNFEKQFYNLKKYFID
tara:strand:+ start:1705 stop:2814 length:1110 start_codon:yes stop_codon:yes gene_type:complete